MATTESYRLVTEEKIDESSSEEGELSSNDDAEWGGKRLKVSDAAMDVANQPCATNTTVNEWKGQRKQNNIWGVVLADQSSNELSNSIGVVGMKNFLSRGPESFSLDLAVKEKNARRMSSSSEDESQPKPMKTQTIEEEMENYMIQRHHMNNKKTTKSFHPSNLKRKRPAKKRKQGSVPNYQPGQCVVLNKQNDISVDDSPEKVSEEIIFRLWEKKRDLIKALVNTIGVSKSLFLYNKTEAVEMSGGLMTLQGNRRRTPGGTFLYLLRNDAEINQNEVNKVFEADYLRDREQWTLLKQAKKQAKEGIIDVGETPQNSPHMETIPTTTNNETPNECTDISVIEYIMKDDN